MKQNKNQITEDVDFTLSFCPRSLFLFTHIALLAKKHSENNLKIKNNTKMKSLITIILLLTLGLGATAQEEILETKIQPFQITFVSPLGTNGLNASNITNKVSINIFAGYNGGVDNFEISGFGDMLKNNMIGAQIAGFGNLVKGTGTGFQASGFFNYTHKNFSGLQVSGFSNIVNSNATAWQITGFGNVVTDQLTGGQIAGFSNYSKGNTVGQASGFMNINSGNLKGFQIAGFCNINTEHIKGTQLSGFFNYTKKLNGVQIAPFNYVDSLENGTPIGIFSIVKNGYKTFEISSNETLYGVVSYKTGTKKFYNIISIGASYKNDMVLWGWGYGIGTIKQLKNDWDLAIELLSYQINQDEWFTETLNQNNKLKLTTSKKVSENLNVFGGISWNVNVSETTDNNGNVFKSSISPWNIFDETYGNNTNIKMYPGFTVGIRF